MAVSMRVTGLKQAATRMRRGLRFVRHLSGVVSEEMWKQFHAELVRGSKRPGRPRQSRFIPFRAGDYIGRIEVGWYGTDYRRVRDYVREPKEAAIKRGFRLGAAKARRRFAAAKF